jgi:hypothetical protein
VSRAWFNDASREGFAKERKLDPDRTRQLFEQGLTQEGYGAEMIGVLGTRILMVLTSANDRGAAHA